MSSSLQADGERVELELPGKGNSMSEVQRHKRTLCVWGSVNVLHC